MKTSAKVTIAAALWLVTIGAWAQIYTCIDANGRKLTSDRPIAECAEREQKELNSNATVKRLVKPVMTAQEQKVFDEAQKAEAEERIRALEDKRRNRALLSRYPNRAIHDKERKEALGQIDEVIKAASKRIGELATQRKAIDEELEFYKKDPGKAPVKLKRQVDENDASVAVQKRFIADQDSEKIRQNTRFDEELVKLKTLWLLTGSPADNAAGPAAASPAARPSSTPKK
jgi:Domain of unknown function (DUF4124)